MGFLGSLVRGFGRVAGKFIETAGNVVENVTGFDGITRFGETIQDLCAEKISTERSYDKQTANVNSTDRLSDTLSSFSDGYLQQADMIENAGIKEVEQYYDALIGLLEKVADDREGKAGLRRLQAGRAKIRSQIQGSVRKPLSQRMSLDDKECLEILKMGAGSEKRSAMRAFSKKVINEALQNTADQVRSSMNEQLEDIEDYLSGIQEGQEKTFGELKARYQNMLSSGNLEAVDKERGCLEPAIIIEEVQLVERILSTGDLA